MIQDADVIVAVDLEKYENNQWNLGLRSFRCQMQHSRYIVKINIIFSKIILADGKSVKPEVNQLYVWFLKHDGDVHRLVSENGIADEKYHYSIQTMTWSTIQNIIKNNMEYLLVLKIQWNYTINPDSVVYVFK